MDDYDPRNHRATGAHVLWAWLTAVIFVLVTTVTVLISVPATPAWNGQVVSVLDRH